MNLLSTSCQQTGKKSENGKKIVTAQIFNGKNTQTFKKDV